eukprot:scaffold1034_cov418-Prasinococcus_capsulatus_cf.AAC.15
MTRVSGDPVFSFHCRESLQEHRQCRIARPLYAVGGHDFDCNAPERPWDHVHSRLQSHLVRNCPLAEQRRGVGVPATQIEFVPSGGRFHYSRTQGGAEDACRDGPVCAPIVPPDAYAPIVEGPRSSATPPGQYVIVAPHMIDTSPCAALRAGNRGDTTRHAFVFAWTGTPAGPYEYLG